MAILAQKTSNINSEKYITQNNIAVLFVFKGWDLLVLTQVQDLHLISLRSHFCWSNDYIKVKYTATGKVELFQVSSIIWVNSVFRVSYLVKYYVSQM